MLGNAHLNGYRLFSIAGWLSAHVALEVRIVYRLNLMVAIFCGAGLFVYFRFFVQFISSISLRLPLPQAGRGRDNTAQDRSRGKSRLRTILQGYVPPAATTLSLRLSETYWSHALSVQGFSVHLFL